MLLPVLLLQGLEALLKSSCEAFIHEAVQMVVGRLLSTLSRYSSTVAASASAAQTWTSFAADAVAQLRATLEALPRLLKVLRRRVSLYMSSGITTAILFKPVYDGCNQTTHAIKTRAAELHEAFVAAAASEDAVGIASEARVDVAATSGSSTALHAEIDDCCATLVRLLVVSEDLCSDTTSATFGYDDHILQPSTSVPITASSQAGSTVLFDA
jgi:hypothetical protein